MLLPTGLELDLQPGKVDPDGLTQPLRLGVGGLLAAVDRDQLVVRSADASERLPDHAAALRVAEHVTRHNLPEVLITFHGGEPLLVGKDRITQYVEILRQRVPGMRADARCQSSCRVRVSRRL